MLLGSKTPSYWGCLRVAASCSSSWWILSCSCCCSSACLRACAASFPAHTFCRAASSFWWSSMPADSRCSRCCSTQKAWCVTGGHRGSSTWCLALHRRISRTHTHTHTDTYIYTHRTFTHTYTYTYTPHINTHIQIYTLYTDPSLTHTY